MSVQTGRMVSADSLRDDAIHQAENWLMAFGALIPADQFQNIAIKLAVDLAKPAIDAVEVLSEQIAAVRTLAERWQSVAADLDESKLTPTIAAIFSTQAGCGDAILKALGVSGE